MSGAGRSAVRAVIRGRVQGVYYRGWTEEEANRRGLAGWVQNMPDGSVKAQFAGPEAAVEAMLAALWQGPRDAEVAAVEVERLAEIPPIAGFRINR
ncbi:MAG: acylphosphatase [Paracoccaceae bacterium]